jgi:hypothetical protein
MTMIRWHLDTPEAQPRTFALEEAKSWKGNLIRGHDIAEMIAQEFWETESIALRKLHITAPVPYSGIYDVTPVFEPIFSAKRTPDGSELVSTAKSRNK